jgi:hypothetical protein
MVNDTIRLRVRKTLKDLVNKLIGSEMLEKNVNTVENARRSHIILVIVEKLV